MAYVEMEIRCGDCDVAIADDARSIDKPCPKCGSDARTYNFEVRDLDALTSRNESMVYSLEGGPISESVSVSHRGGTLTSGVDLLSQTYRRAGSRPGARPTTKADEMHAGCAIAHALAASDGVRWTVHHSNQAEDVYLKHDSERLNVQVTQLDTVVVEELKRDGRISEHSETATLESLDDFVRAALKRKGPEKYPGEVRADMILALLVRIPVGSITTQRIKAAVTASADHGYKEIWLVEIEHAVRLWSRSAK